MNFIFKKTILSIFVCFIFLSACSKKEEAPVNIEEITFTELEWESLMPPINLGPLKPPPVLEDDISLQIENSIAQSANEISGGYSEEPVEALDGTFVKLPGFIVPIEMQGDLISEFLLVPYYGACIHTPPPAKNQIVYVKTKPMLLTNLFQAFWVKGKLNVEDTSSDLGDSGYLLEAYSIEVYQ